MGFSYKDPNLAIEHNLF